MSFSLQEAVEYLMPSGLYAKDARPLFEVMECLLDFWPIFLRFSKLALYMKRKI